MCCKANLDFCCCFLNFILFYFKVSNAHFKLSEESNGSFDMPEVPEGCPSPFLQGSPHPAHSPRHHIKFPSTISPCLCPALAQLHLCLAMGPADLTRGRVKLSSMMISICPQPALITTSLTNHELYLTLAPHTVPDCSRPGQGTVLSCPQTVLVFHCGW